MLITCKVLIPDTQEAKDALNKTVGKILRAHGAQNNDFFEIVEETKEDAGDGIAATTDAGAGGQDRIPDEKPADNEPPKKAKRGRPAKQTT